MKLLVSAVYANQQVLNAVEVTTDAGDSFVPSLTGMKPSSQRHLLLLHSNQQGSNRNILRNLHLHLLNPHSLPRINLSHFLPDNLRDSPLFLLPINPTLLLLPNLRCDLPSSLRLNPSFTPLNSRSVTRAAPQRRNPWRYLPNFLPRTRPCNRPSSRLANQFAALLGVHRDNRLINQSQVHQSSRFANQRVSRLDNPSSPALRNNLDLCRPLSHPSSIPSCQPTSSLSIDSSFQTTHPATDHVSFETAVYSAVTAAE